jgi:hypothetical protein
MSFILFLTNLSILIAINFDFKKVLIFFSIILAILILTFKFNSSVNDRITNFIDDLSDFKKSNHFKLFASAAGMWQQNPVLGVGLKNFRIICDENKINNITNENYIYNISFLINKKYYGLFIGSALVILMYFWPLKSSGSFVTTFSASFFWFNIGIISLLSNSSKNIK